MQSDLLFEVYQRYDLVRWQTGDLLKLSYQKLWIFQLVLVLQEGSDLLVSLQLVLSLLVQNVQSVLRVVVRLVRSHVAVNSVLVSVNEIHKVVIGDCPCVVEPRSDIGSVLVQEISSVSLWLSHALVYLILLVLVNFLK